jgi:hypothetical protein
MIIQFLCLHMRRLLLSLRMSNFLLVEKFLADRCVLNLKFLMNDKFKRLYKAQPNFFDKYIA